MLKQIIICFSIPDSLMGFGGLGGGAPADLSGVLQSACGY